jgi:hypothetical protein
MTENLPEKKKPGFRLTTRKVGWLLLILVWLVGLFLIWYGRAKIAEGELLKQQLELNNRKATQQLAKSVRQELLLNVTRQLDSKNYGEAGDRLKNAKDLVEIISIIAVTDQEKQVNEIKASLGQAAEQLDSDPSKVKDLLVPLGQQLDALSGGTSSGG